MLDDGRVKSPSDIATRERLTRRVTQIINLVRLPAEMQEFLLKLDSGSK